MQQVAGEAGTTLQEPRFGDTISLELVRDGRRRFSFQIAVRSIALEESVPSAWPPLRIETLGEERAYDVSADGQRFLMIKDVSEGSANIAVHQGWFEKLRRLADSNRDEARHRTSDATCHEMVVSAVASSLGMRSFSKSWAGDLTSLSLPSCTSSRMAATRPASRRTRSMAASSNGRLKQQMSR
jgi:hypothetical protein